MSQYGPPNPPSEQPGPAGSYGWSSQQGQPMAYPGGGAPNPYVQASQPGTLPLRPLVLGDYFSAMFSTIRNAPGLFFGSALIFGSIAAILAATAEFFMMRSFGPMLAPDPYAGVEQFMSGSIFGALGALVLSQLVMLVGQTFNWGIYAIMVARGAVGLKTTLSQGFRLMRGQWGKLIGFMLLLVLASFVLYGVIALLGFVLFALVFAGGEPESGGVIAVFILGLLAVIFLPLIVALYFIIRWQLAIPAIVIENIGIFAALRRSWGLTKGYFWRTLGIVLLFAVILGIVSAIITSPLTFISGFILAAAGTEAELLGSMLVINLLVTAIASLAGFIVTNMGVLISIFFYFDYRFRAEGLGLHFQQLAAQHTAGSAPDRFDTSMEARARGLDDANDVIPGRHVSTPTPPPNFGSHYPGSFGSYPPSPPGSCQ